MGEPEAKKKRGGVFMKFSIIITALYVLGVVAAVIIFQARQNPIDPMTVTALIGVGMGELGACGLIKTASERRAAAEAEKESAEAEIEAAKAEAEEARAEAEQWKAKYNKKKAPAKPAAKPPAPESVSALTPRTRKKTDATSAPTAVPEKPPTKRKKGGSP